MERKLLFSVTADDCKWSYRRGSGPGGQKRNKTSSSVHCVHAPSGAMAYSDETRSQHQNKKLAFQKMCETFAFKNWHIAECMRLSGKIAEIEAYVEKEMTKVKVEKKNDEGKWEVWREENETTK